MSAEPRQCESERVKQIVRCVNEIHRCEAELASDKTGTGAWLGYMDWLQALHEYIWDWNEETRQKTVQQTVSEVEPEPSSGLRQGAAASKNKIHEALEEEKPSPC